MLLTQVFVNQDKVQTGLLLKYNFAQDEDVVEVMEESGDEDDIPTVMVCGEEVIVLL